MNEFIARNGLIAQNNSTVSGSLEVTNGITGSLLGTASTASYVQTAQTASYVQTAQTASYVVTAQTASYVLQAVSASYATLAQTANTASFVVTAQTASYVLNAVSSSFATTASYVANASSFPFTGSAIITGSLVVTGSTTSTLGFTGSLQGTASNAVSSSFATTASFALNAGGGGFPYTGSAIISGSLSVIGPTTMTGSLAVSSSQTGSVFSVSASYIDFDFDSFLFSGSTTFQGSIVSTATTASFTALSATTASLTGSLLGTASYATQALSSSFATTASFALNAASGGGFPFTGSAVITGSLAVIGRSRVTGSVTAANTESLVFVNQSITQTNATGSAAYQVFINPIFTNNAPSQTQTALRINATFTGSQSGSNTQNLIADFGAANVGSQFTVNDTTSGSIYMVNDVSGLPIIEATSNWDVNIYDYPNIVFKKTGSAVIISGSLTVTSGSITMPTRPAFRVSGSASTDRAATTTLSGSIVGIDYNQGSYYNNTTGVFTAPIAGLYSVYMNIRCGSVNSQQQAILYKNSTSVLMWEAAGNTGATHFGVSGIVNLAVNDTLKVTVAVGSIQFDANDSWGAVYIG